MSSERSSQWYCLGLLLVLVPSMTAQHSTQSTVAPTAQTVRQEVVLDDGSDTEPSIEDEIMRLRRRIDLLETRADSAEVNLSPTTTGPVDHSAAHVLARPWFENLDVWGFAAGGLLGTGDRGTQQNPGFIIKETSLFVDASVWEGASMFFEVQVNRLAKDDQLFLRTGEVHAHFRDLLGDDCLGLDGLKIGRIDIPFGEEYLAQDSSDNPLISNSAPYPYGFDEGLLLYGSRGGVDWIASVTDGSDKRSLDDNLDKAINVKISGRPAESLYLSLSAMRNGAAMKSAFEFGGSHFQPVGASHASSAGTSTRSKAGAELYEVDARYDFEQGAYISAAFGQAFVHDPSKSFDRDILWYTVEGFHRFCQNWYGVARYSEIGTYHSREGYHFDGKILAGGNGVFGYDVRRLQRTSLGLGWEPNQRTTVKAELGWDTFDLIQSSTLRRNNNGGWFAGLELVVTF